MADLRPRTYEAWHHCITEICGIPLTKHYIHARIQALNNHQDHMTSRFIELYGEEQRQKTLAWFDRALHEAQ